jgi:hypothetical protein
MGRTSPHSWRPRLTVPRADSGSAGTWYSRLSIDHGLLLRPLDEWFGTYHDGSQEANEQMKNRRREPLERKER